jgi:catechol 2,3-dioxygenase-like lactoylglutathione lyase family enzyme
MQCLFPACRPIRWFIFSDAKTGLGSSGHSIYFNAMKPARLTGSAPVLLVRDVRAAANYYRDALGFSYTRFWGAGPDFVILERDGLRLMLDRAPENAEIVPHWKLDSGMWNVYFWVDDVEVLFAEFTAKGAKIDYGLDDKPYDIREFGVQDLDGYDIGFGQPICK